MACNNWPDTLYSRSALYRDPVESFLQVHKAHIDWLGLLPYTLKNTHIVGAHPPVPLLKQGKNLKKRKTPADHPVTLRRVGILNCHLAYISQDLSPTQSSREATIFSKAENPNLQAVNRGITAITTPAFHLSLRATSEWSRVTPQ